MLFFFCVCVIFSYFYIFVGHLVTEEVKTATSHGHRPSPFNSPIIHRRLVQEFKGYLAKNAKSVKILQDNFFFCLSQLFQSTVTALSLLTGFI